MAAKQWLLKSNVVNATERWRVYILNQTELLLSKEAEDLFALSYSGDPVGKIELYNNAFHSQNQHLRLHLKRFENAWAKSLFSQIQQMVEKPLQVMLSSEDVEQVAFLLAGDFVCKRKCYEMEVTSQDYLAYGRPTTLELAKHGEPKYTASCQLLYDYYKETHVAVSPLTADFVTFCKHLPTEVFCGQTDGQIQHFAFIERNEIAYIGSTDMSHFLPFAEAVASKILAEYESLCFECDDCDVAAMALKRLFRTEVQYSYNTYVR